MISSITQYMSELKQFTKDSEREPDVDAVKAYLDRITTIGHDRMDILFPRQEDFSLFMNTVQLTIHGVNPMFAHLVPPDLLVTIAQYILGVAEDEGWFDNGEELFK